MSNSFESIEQTQGDRSESKKSYNKPKVESIDESPEVLDMMAEGRAMRRIKKEVREERASDPPPRSMAQSMREGGIDYDRIVHAEAGPEDYAKALKELRSLREEVANTPKVKFILQRMRGILELAQLVQPSISEDGDVLDALQKLNDDSDFFVRLWKKSALEINGKQASNCSQLPETIIIKWKNEK